MEISISIPAGKFEVSGVPTHASLFDHLESRIDYAAGKYSWRINRGLFPGQGLEISWEPIDDKAFPPVDKATPSEMDEQSPTDP